MRILNASDEQKGDAADSPFCSPGEFFFCLSKCVKPVISIEQAMHSFLIIKSNDRRVWTLCSLYHWAKVLLTLFLSLRHAYESKSTPGYKNVCSPEMKKPTGHPRLFEKRRMYDGTIKFSVVQLRRDLDPANVPAPPPKNSKAPMMNPML
jgi:hypothetical protein